MKPEVINISEIDSIKSALLAYNTLVNTDKSNLYVIKGDVTVDLENILAYSSTPSLGFKKGVLPGYLSNIRIDNTRLNVEVLFTGKLSRSDLEEERKSWEEKEGYTTKKSLIAFDIKNSEDKIIATYKKDKISIDKDYLDEFISNL